MEAFHDFILFMLSDDSSEFHYAIDIGSEMSLFERKAEAEFTKRNLDESAQLVAFITNSVTVDSHTVSSKQQFFVRYSASKHSLNFKYYLRRVHSISFVPLYCNSVPNHLLGSISSPETIFWVFTVRCIMLNLY